MIGKKKIPKTSHQALSKILETDRTSRKMTLGTSHFTLIYGHDAMLHANIIGRPVIEKSSNIK
jgi:hypothetical protein